MEEHVIEAAYGWRCEGHCRQRVDGMWKSRTQAEISVRRMNEPEGTRHQYVLTETITRDAL